MLQRAAQSLLGGGIARASAALQHARHFAAEPAAAASADFGYVAQVRRCV